MSVHFENNTAAVAELAKWGFTQIENGRWVSKDKSCAAHILKRFDEVVLVQVWEIQ